MNHPDPAPPALPDTPDDDSPHLEFAMFGCRTCTWHSPWFPRRSRTEPAHDSDHATRTGHRGFYLYTLTRAHSEITDIPTRQRD